MLLRYQPRDNSSSASASASAGSVGRGTAILANDLNLHLQQRIIRFALLPYYREVADDIITEFHGLVQWSYSPVCRDRPAYIRHVITVSYHTHYHIILLA